MRCTILLLNLVFLNFSCHTIDKGNRNAFDLDSIQKERLRITLINDSTQIKWTIKEYIGFWSPSENQMSIIDSIISKGIGDQNRKYRRLNTTSYKDYFRQFVCYVQPGGDSIVYVNAICRVNDNPMEDDSGNLYSVREDWQHELIRVKDGGDCFWCIWINFSKKKYQKLVVNGMA